MLAFPLVFAGLAAAIHVYIFILESVLWVTPRARKVFGTTEEEAQSTRLLALNQGYYNLFLAVTTVLGIVLTLGGGALSGANSGLRAAGLALLIAGAGSMVLAGLVLIASDRSKTRSGIVQLTTPALALLFLGLTWIVTGL
ncbi:DUF1304 domain-containing protein [Psychromicrobium xiongbiense]|uniref:DUF1304 domain-containing protein n=1 Tax=Psychromicrobium xiongbiense TaxID=3051184 RepID=UPI002557B542|nr:DUF1304 domain-containing protein [Psychromicrobium sp. YIM S02556]